MSASPIALSRSLALAAAFATVVACTATETGNPPGDARDAGTPDDPGGSIEVDREGLSGQLASSPAMPTEVTFLIAGGAGTIDPAEGQVWIWALSSSEPPIVADVEPDGSFSTSFGGGFGPDDRFRLLARAGASASSPIDFRFSLGGLRFDESDPPCADVTPGPIVRPEARAGASVDLVLTNRCETAIERTRARLRSGDAAFRVDDEGALTVEPGASTTIRVTVVDPDGNPDEIVIVPLSSAPADFAAINVILAP